jgi:hypothetical protein
MGGERGAEGVKRISDTVEAVERSPIRPVLAVIERGSGKSGPRRPTRAIGAGCSTFGTAAQGLIPTSRIPPLRYGPQPPRRTGKSGAPAAPNRM